MSGLPRCCKNTLDHYGPRQPREGLELGCRWCTNFLRYERIGNSELCGWMPHESTKDFVEREGSHQAIAAREARAKEITMGRYDDRLKYLPTEKACPRCAILGHFTDGTLKEILPGDLAVYICEAGHQSVRDVSELLSAVK